MKIKIILVCMILLVFTQVASAHFVCGQVEDSDDNRSAAWFSVRVYYIDDPSKYAGCDISPEENKYCCDVEEIPLKSWQVGDVVYAEIIDTELGYVAGPVSIQTSGEGYDILPKMKLEKVVSVYSPRTDLIVSSDGFVNFSASFLEPFNHVELIKNNETDLLCENCSVYEGSIEADFGMNYWNILASGNEIIFFEKLIFAVLNWFEFNREFVCEGCFSNKVKTSRVVRVDAKLNLSDYVNGLELKEYVPVEWRIINSTGRVEEYSESHNVVIWNITGQDVIREYYVNSPWVLFFPKRFVFRTELGDHVLSEGEVIVYRWFWFFYTGGNFLNRVNNRGLMTDISPIKPLVLYNQGIIDTIAIFPKKRVRDVEFELRPYEGEEISDVIEAYEFYTNLEKHEIKKIYLEFKISKDKFSDYESWKLFVFDDLLQEVSITHFKEDENYFYYKLFLESTKGIAFVGEKKKFLGII